MGSVNLLGVYDDTGGNAGLGVVVRVCIGIAFFDSMGDLEGSGLSTALLAGTGPEDDADNSRWIWRICYDIPLGFLLTQATGNETYTLPVINRDYYSLSGVWNGLDMTFSMNIDVDHKTIRKLHGLETKWINLALQMVTTTGIPATSDFTMFINSFNARSVLSLA